jgi:SAM-dependent methyltransferase
MGLNLSQDSYKKHWTHKLFVENAELYLPFLEQGKERALHEAIVLSQLLEEQGVRPNSKLLDVACGIGRHAVLMAQRGYQVSGLDISLLYVEKAQEYASSQGVDVDFQCGDVLQVASHLGDAAPFDAIVNMFTSHSYYGWDGDLTTFRQLRELASDNAVLVILTSNRDAIVRKFTPEAMDKAGDVRILQLRYLDLETSTMHNEWEFFEGQNESLKLSLSIHMEHRLYSLHDMKRLLEEAGWTYVKAMGQSDEAGDEAGGLIPLTIDSNIMWVVARA